MLSEEERQAGVRRVVSEAAWSNLTATVTSGALLSAFALHMGANNLVIGILGAAPFLSQMLQIPTVLLIEQVRRRRPIAVRASIIGRVALLVGAIAAFFPGNSSALAAVVAMQLLFCAAGSVGGCAWNAWIRDLVPEERLGSVIARRTALGASIGMVAGIAAAVALDQATGQPTLTAGIYGALYAAAAVAGLVSAWLVGRIPEPAMPPLTARPDLTAILKAAFAEKNFRRVMLFLGSWQFAANLAAPFFTVFLLDQLELSLVWAMALSLASQLASIAALRTWGALSDRFSNKSVLGVVAPAYLLCILGFVVASQISGATPRVIWLLVIHLVMGAASAGVTLASANIVLKLSPRGESASYLAVSALVTAGAAGAAALLGGAFADFFAKRSLAVVLQWTNPGGELSLAPLTLTGWDFYFILAGLAGLFALHRLALVREAGEIDRRAMLDQVALQARRSVQSLSSGAAAVSDLPASLMRELAIRARLHRAQAHRRKPVRK